MVLSTTNLLQSASDANPALSIECGEMTEVPAELSIPDLFRLPYPARSRYPAIHQGRRRKVDIHPSLIFFFQFRVYPAYTPPFLQILPSYISSLYTFIEIYTHDNPHKPNKRHNHGHLRKDDLLVGHPGRFSFQHRQHPLRHNLRLLFHHTPSRHRNRRLRTRPQELLSKGRFLRPPLHQGQPLRLRAINLERLRRPRSSSPPRSPSLPPRSSVPRHKPLLNPPRR